MREAKERPFQPGILGGMQELPLELPPPEPAIAPSGLVYVTLDLEEQERVRVVAAKVARRYEAGKDEQGRAARMKYLPPGLTIYDVNEQGFGAELAVSVTLELPWNEGKRGRADVGQNVEVRQSRRDDAHLTLHSFDKLARIYVLAVGRFPTYRLAGWELGSNAAGAGAYYPPGSRYPYRPDVLGKASSHGVWILPQSKLRRMAELEVRRTR